MFWPPATTPPEPYKGSTWTVPVAQPMPFEEIRARAYARVLVLFIAVLVILFRALPLLGVSVG